MANQANINKLLREGNALKRDSQKILAEETKKTGMLSSEVKKTNDAYKEKIALLKDINEKVKEARDTTKEQIGDLMAQEQALKGLTGLQASLAATDRIKIELLSKQTSMYPAQREAIASISNLNQDLLKTSAEDIVSRKEIKRNIEAEISALDKKSKNLGIGSKKLLAAMKEQYKIADGISSLTEEEQKQLEAQTEAYDTIKKTIGGILDTASALTKTSGGIVGGLVVGLGYVAEAIGKTTREMGGFVGGLTGATSQVTLLSTIFPDALSTAKGLSAEFGGLSEMSFQTQLNTNLMATNMGISGDQAAQLTGNFARLNGGSVETAQNLAESTKQLAKQNGLVPSAIMADVAGSAKSFAEYGKDGGINMGIAAVAAGKLGVNMNTLTNVTDSLLDFETSITKELELGAMLGRNVNLSKARQLAFDGKIGASVKNALQQMGGVAAFEKMSIFQKRAAADALGLSADELLKMSSNMDKLNDDGTMQLSTFDTWYESLTAFATGPLGSTLKGLGSGIIAAGQMSTGFASMGVNMGGMVKGSFQLLKNLGLMAIAAAKSRLSKMGVGGGGLAKKAGDYLKTSKVGKSIGSFKDKAMSGVKEKFAGKDIASKTKIPKGKTKIPKGKGKGKAPGASMIESFNKIDMKSVLKGAAAMVILAAALYISAKAFQEFATVKWESVAKGIVGLTAMAGVAYLLGKAKGDMLKGALAVAVLGIALVPFAFAMSLIAGLEIGSVIAAAAGLLIFGAAVFGLGLLMMGPGAFVFGAGLLALAGLGLAMVILGGGLLIAAAGFSAISGALSGIVETITSIFPAIAGVVSLAVPIAIFAYSLFGLALGLAAFGIAAALALPSVMGIAIAIALLGTGLTMMGNGLNLIGGSLSSVVASITELSPVLGTITAMIGPIAMLSMALLGLTASLFGLGIAMAFLGIAGLPGLLVLGGIAAIAGTIIKVAEFFGLGGSGESESSETGGLEAGSLSEYETNMLTKMDQLISATISQRNIYLDKDKVTKSVVDHAEKGTMNTYDINRT
jgi:hypothetical protein